MTPSETTMASTTNSLVAMVDSFTCMIRSLSSLDAHTYGGCIVGMCYFREGEELLEINPNAAAEQDNHEDGSAEGVDNDTNRVMGDNKNDVEAFTKKVDDYDDAKTPSTRSLPPTTSVSLEHALRVWESLLRMGCE